ncbi:MAG: NAD(P)/FAD-dependent oxidoreductase [Burkholderiales bacterium]|nr:NAD(P)/FAD-dependent oxidoreductase [Burkholderiales bacterium]
MSDLVRRDAVIVGGGPAGSTLARALARSGASVTVLDQRNFPRDKTCAGWITPAVIGSLGLDLEKYRRRGHVLQPIHGFRVARMGDRPVHNDHGAEPVSYGIRRCEFDHFLLARSGAELRTGAPIESMERAGSDWIVNGALRTPLLVGAGGHFCPVARALGADLGRGEAVVGAQEFEVQMTPEQAARSSVRGDTPQLYFCPDLAGYAWVVRKGNWLNVGIGRRNPRELGEHMDHFLAGMVREGVLDPELARSRAKGHAYLLYPDAARPLIAEGALLVGDAAGLAYPESGEGIRPAVESALLAAEAIRACNGQYTAGRLQAYSEKIQDRFGDRRVQASAPAPNANPLKQFAASLLMRTRWFTREFVTRRWFLHEHVAPLPCPAPLVGA